MTMSNEDTDFVASLTDDKSDPELGAAVREHLVGLGLENTYTPIDDDTQPRFENEPSYKPKQAFAHLRDGIYMAYKLLGLDVERDPSIQDTPNRFAKMFVGELTKGLNYDFFPKCTATPNGNVLANPAPVTRNPVGPEDSIIPVQWGAYNQMVLVKNIRTTSLCEHHLQTIDGFTHIAYIPGPKVLGLSKFARVAEFFAARPQIQERMTEQIHAALCFILETDDVAVAQSAVHFCMRARGVKQPESWTDTNKLTGRFLSNVALREEFLNGCSR